MFKNASVLLLSFFSSVSFAQVEDASRFQRDHSTTDFLYSQKPKAAKNPKGMEFDHTGKVLIVANLYGRTNAKANVTVINATSKKVIKEIDTPNGVGYKRGAYHSNGTVEVAFTKDNKFALVTRLQGCRQNGAGCNGGSPSELTSGGMLNVIRVSDLKPVLYIPTKAQGSKIIGIKPGSTKVYITNWFTNSVSVLDIAEAYNMRKGAPAKFHKAGFKKIIKFPSKAIPRGLAFTSGGKYMYALGFGDGRLYILSTERDVILGRTPKTGYKINFRHMAVSKDERVAFFSHLQGDAISRIDMTYMDDVADTLNRGGSMPSKFWERAFIPWDTTKGKRNLLKLDDYAADHPSVPNQTYGSSDPNTIVLDPINNCYLYVSFRSGNMSGSRALNNGKVDVIDVCNDRRVISLYAGKGPTALAVTHQGDLLASSAFFGNEIWFYNSKKIKKAYEKEYGVPRWR